MCVDFFNAAGMNFYAFTTFYYNLRISKGNCICMYNQSFEMKGLFVSSLKCLLGRAVIHTAIHTLCLSDRRLATGN